ncbi:MAG: methyltransferase domain-containing protein [Bacteroidetes bacterium]|nr:methyltransferase domain-containing protein [Bacteroidota bacterium]
MTIEKLSEQKHWESINAPVNDVIKTEKKPKKAFRIFTYSYSFHLLWDVLLPKYIKTDRNAKVMEVGSAPGKNLLLWHNKFLNIPFGVEYTDAGVDANRKLFAANNLNPENIIKADFLSDEFLRANHEKYDYVYSMGFIEHFNDPEQIVSNHLKILKPGGILFISIPNLKGLYNFALKIFYPEILKIHNLEIMELKEYKKLFDVQKNLEIIHCGYHGTIDLNILQFGKYRFMNTLCHYFQMLLNFCCKMLLGKKGLESRFTSPYLVFIGKKN